MHNQQDQNSIDERKDLMELDAASCDRIEAAKASIMKSLPAALDKLFDKISTTGHLNDLFEPGQSRDHARDKQTEHWEKLASGAIDQDFLRSSRQVGDAHARIGLEPKYHISSYALVASTLIEGVIKEQLESGGKKKGLFGGSKSSVDANELAATVSAIVKATFMDVELSVGSMFHQRRLETENVNSEVQRVVKAAQAGDFTQRATADVSNEHLNALVDSTNDLMHSVGDGLARADNVLSSLAEADLTQRMDGNFQGAFNQLQGNINTVADQLY